MPDQPGLYAMYGSNPSVWRVLGLGAPPDERPLYVGKAKDSLVSRDLKVWRYWSVLASPLVRRTALNRTRVDGDPPPTGAIESDGMTHWRPPLNLIGVSQPWQPQVKRARAVMAAGAKAWAADRTS